MKIKLAAIAKNEAAYIPQWIFHHLKCGFDGIEIWINGTTDNSRAMIAKISEAYPGRIALQEADELLEICKTKELNFQTQAYKKIFEETKAKGEFTHLFFLDLDEYWMSSAPDVSIHDFLSSRLDADAISLQWFIDTPDYARDVFERIIKNEYFVRKDRHVKTILKISDRINQVLIHNSKITNGIFLLPDGTELAETDPEQEHRQKVSKEYFNKTQMEPEDFFIFHFVHRSQTEYTASLMRGRVHVNDNHIFKFNRAGYIPKHHSDEQHITFNESRTLTYNHQYDDFLLECGLSSLLAEAKDFVHAKCNHVLDLLSTNPELIQRYSLQLSGLQIDHLQKIRRKATSPHHHIDVIRLDSGTLEIRGWVFDPLSNDPIQISVEPDFGSMVGIERMDRPDVVKAYPTANIDCGFKVLMEIKGDHSFLQDQSSPVTVLATNTYFNVELKTSKKLTIAS
ncbi:glycosyltransferase family 2 protein [Pseudomonas sp. App30]|uniref:glycosyltransferase family 2 protein n=1 Tax=Pseudomonas sp. App30 TaxID=3068990 RepID=UPI003A803886